MVLVPGPLPAGYCTGHGVMDVHVADRQAPWHRSCVWLTPLLVYVSATVCVIDSIWAPSIHHRPPRQDVAAHRGQCAETARGPHAHPPDVVRGSLLYGTAVWG